MNELINHRYEYCSFGIEINSVSSNNEITPPAPAQDRLKMASDGGITNKHLKNLLIPAIKPYQITLLMKCLNRKGEPLEYFLILFRKYMNLPHN